MNDVDKEEFFRCLFELGAAMRSRVSETLLDVYWHMLSDFPIADVREGCARSVRYDKALPPPKVLRDRVVEARRDRPKQLQLAAPVAPAEYRKKAFPVVFDALAGKESVEALRRLRDEYPGVGWEEALADAEARLAAKGGS